MRLNLTCRHFKASPKLKDFVEGEVRRLKRYYDGIIECEVILNHEKAAVEVAELVLKVYGQRLTVVERSDDMKKSVASAVDKLERQLKRYKEKLRHRSHERATDLLVEEG
jgi:putative sigma-54 modulation protein